MIDILIPVLGRPDKAAKVADSIRQNTQNPHTIIFVATRGDHAEIEACKETGAVVHLIDEFGYSAKINSGVHFQAASHASDFVFLGADDIAFRPFWDVAAIEAWSDTGKPVIGTNDLGNPTVMAGRHATHSLVHRSYVEQGTIDDPTKLLHEGYQHNWVDTEFIATARYRNAWVFASGSHVEHLHPAWHKGEDDEIYQKGRAGYHQDSRLFQKRSKLWR